MTGRIVHVVRSDGFAGVERYVADVAGELSRRGWTVTVVGGDSERMRAETPDPVTVRAARTTADVIRQLWALGRADVVHAHMTAAELPAVLLKRRFGGALFATRHFAAVRGRSPAGRVVRPILARGVDHQLAISRFVADHIDGPSTVLHNGVRPRVPREISRGPVVVMLQRLEAEKDTETAIRAWASCGLGGAGWTLRIFGRGAEAESLVTLAGRLGCAASIEFRGFTDRVRDELAAASMLLATAPAEPFGLSVVEAMAEATPVVAADGGAHRETLGENGVFFPSGNAQECANALVALAGDERRRTASGDALRARQRSRFSVEVHVDRLESLYRAAAPNQRLDGWGPADG